MNVAVAYPSVPEVGSKQAKSLPAAPVVLIYFVFCLLCFVAAFIGIDHRQAAATNFLSRSTFFYSGRNYASASLAVQIANRFHIRTLDLYAPGTGNVVYRLTGAQEAASPTLVVPTQNGTEVLSGTEAVNQMLEPFSPQQSPYQKAKWALAFMAGLIILTIVFESELSAVAAYLPLLGFIAIGALWGRCLNCSVGGSLLSTFAPVAGLVYLGGGGTLFTWVSQPKRVLYIFFLCVSAVVPALQALMLVSEPKLCPSCLGITLISAAYFISCLRVLSSSILSGLRMPKALGTAMGIGLCLLLTRHLLVLGGYVSAGEVKETAVPSVIGRPLSHYVSALPHPQPGLVYVVTLNGCSHCEQAKHDLAGSGIRWRQIPICTLAQGGVCFDGGSIAFPAPMILVCNKQGRITYQSEGWGNQPQDVAEKESQLLAMQRRTAAYP